MATLLLTFNEVLEIHRDQIDRYGGLHGLRDAGLLTSALAQPGASFAGQPLHSDIFEMAAAYLFHLVSNHPFVDGNKRVGTVAALVFLAMNRVSINASNDDLVALVLNVAQGQSSKEIIADFFRCHAV